MMNQTLPIRTLGNIASVRRSPAAAQTTARVAGLKNTLPLQRRAQLQRRASTVPQGRGQVKTMASATPAGFASAENFQGEVVTPSVANKNLVRLAASFAAVAVAARGTGYLPVKTAAFLHFISYAINFGMIFWVTFVAGLTMFKNMTRQAFGKVQAKLFPKYFAISVVTLALQLGTLKFALPVGLQREQLTSLGIALVASLVNWVVEPLGTKVLFQRYELENASGPKDKDKILALKKQFSKFHGLSSLLNLVVLVATVSHGYWLSSLLAFA